MANYLQPCKCQSSDCPVVLLLHDQSRHLACKPTLINVSDYFEAMFRNDFKEKQTNEVKLQDDIYKSDLTVFLDVIHNRFKPVPNDAKSLRSLIFLADRFICPSMETGILPHLINGSLFQASPDIKLELLETADKHRGTSSNILEATVRLCGNLDLDKVSSLHRKISNGTLAATLLFVGKIKSQLHAAPLHDCLELWLCEQSIRSGTIVDKPYDQVSNGSWACSLCSSQGPKVKDINFRCERITFEMVQKISINKDMFG